MHPDPHRTSIRVEVHEDAAGGCPEGPRVMIVTGKLARSTRCAPIIIDQQTVFAHAPRLLQLLLQPVLNTLEDSQQRHECAREALQLVSWSMLWSRRVPLLLGSL